MPIIDISSQQPVTTHEDRIKVLELRLDELEKENIDLRNTIKLLGDTVIDLGDEQKK